MVIVVLGDEETEIRDGHRLAETRMERGAGELGGSHSSKPVDDSATGGSEVGQDLRDRAIVMGGLVCFAILQIGRVQLGGACVVIIQAQGPQRFEIKKVANIFLDGPLAVALPGQGCTRQSANGLSQPFRRAPKSFHEFGSDLRAEAEIKLAIEPASPGHFVT